VLDQTSRRSAYKKLGAVPMEDWTVPGSPAARRRFAAV
jgi:hypothetical protein